MKYTCGECGADATNTSVDQGRTKHGCDAHPADEFLRHLLSSPAPEKKVLRIAFNGEEFMPVPRCDGCRHWAEGYCTRVKYDPNSKAVVIRLTTQGTPYILPPHVHLETQPDFGCVQWEAR